MTDVAVMNNSITGINNSLVPPPASPLVRTLTEKLCGACSQTKIRLDFSKKQWDKKHRRCKDCVQMDLPFARPSKRDHAVNENVKVHVHVAAVAAAASEDSGNDIHQNENSPPLQGDTVKGAALGTASSSRSTNGGSIGSGAASIHEPEILTTNDENIRSYNNDDQAFETPVKKNRVPPKIVASGHGKSSSSLEPHQGTTSSSSSSSNIVVDDVNEITDSQLEDQFLSPELKTSIARVSQLLETPIDDILQAKSLDDQDGDSDGDDCLAISTNTESPVKGAAFADVNLDLSTSLTPKSKENLKNAVLELGTKLTATHSIHETQSSFVSPDSDDTATDDIESLARNWQPTPTTPAERRPLLSPPTAPLTTTTTTQEADTSISEASNDDNNDEDDTQSLRHILTLLASPLLDEGGNARSVRAGFLSLFLVGATIGLITPKNDSLPTPWYRTVSAMIGYIYFLGWSVSFYPQVISNWKRKSTQGLSADFCVLNVVGFACYTAYNASFFWSPTIQSLYKERYGTDVTVQSNDVAFAIHALLLSSITLGQIGYYGASDGETQSSQGQQRPSKIILGTIAVLLSICAIYPLFVLGNVFNWLDYLYVLSFIKVFISLIKYIPQVVLNHKRQSTVGWSIWNILLDFTGGVLSDTQLVLDCADMGDFSGITGNLAKFGLGILSMTFDIIFMVQHYILYPEDRQGRQHAPSPEFTEPLLSIQDRRSEENNINDDNNNNTNTNDNDREPEAPQQEFV